MKTVRTPKQKRSVEKKLKIIEKGFELMCDNGYYKTNTNDIAKYAMYQRELYINISLIKKTFLWKVLKIIQRK